MQTITLKQKIVGVLLGLVALLGGGYSAVTLGNADVAAYSNATTTGSFSAATIVMLKTGQGVLGNIVIGTTSATTFELRDATSTTDIASTTLLSLAASPAIGSSMSPQVVFTRGLSIVFPPSFVGRYTVSYE